MPNEGRVGNNESGKISNETLITYSLYIIDCHKRYHGKHPDPKLKAYNTITKTSFS